MKPLDVVQAGTKVEVDTPRSEMATRLVSAAVLAVLALGAVVLSPWTFAALVVTAGVAIAWEWGRLVRGRNIDGIVALQAAAVAAVAIFLTVARPDFALAAVAAAFAGTVALELASRSGAPSKVPPSKTLGSETLGWSLVGLAYSVLPAWAMVWLRGDAAFGTTALLYLFAVAWTTDSASYVGGRLLKGPKLAPRISPNKTWSGLILGTLTPAFVGYSFGVLLQETSPWRLALVSVVIAAACQIGDLGESAVKRRFGAKDMSGLIPGHGGLLDRIDGLLIAAVAAALIAVSRDPTSPGRGLLIW